ncbi:MAG: TetR/AcrR family transcriptional regulator [Actinomycetota bacterium]
MTSATHTGHASPDAEQATRGRPRDEERTIAILDAARDLMRTGGWDDFTMQDIATAAGCGLATIYRRWDNKEDLVAACIRHRPLPVIEPTGDAETDLRALLYGFAEEMQEKGEAMFGFLAATRTDPVLRDAMDESIMGTARDRLRGLMVELMGDSRHVETVLDASLGLLLVRDGLLGGTSPEAYVEDVLALIHTLASC